MDRFPKNVLRIALAGVAMAVIVAYGWITNFGKQNEMKRVSKALPPADKCTDETVATSEQTNPNVKLFVGCGGFFE